MSDQTKTVRKPSISLPNDIYEEMVEQAEKYGVSVSKCAQDAWRIARCYSGTLPNGVAIFRDGPLDEVETDDE